MLYQTSFGLIKVFDDKSGQLQSENCSAVGESAVYDGLAETGITFLLVVCDFYSFSVAQQFGTIYAHKFSPWHLAAAFEFLAECAGKRAALDFPKFSRGDFRR